MIGAGLYEHSLHRLPCTCRHNRHKCLVEAAHPGGTLLSPEELCSLKPCSHKVTAKVPACVAPCGARCDSVVVHVVDLGGVPSGEAQLEVHAGRLLLLKPCPVGVGVACGRQGAGAWALLQCRSGASVQVAAVANKNWPGNTAKTR